MAAGRGEPARANGASAAQAAQLPHDRMKLRREKDPPVPEVLPS